MELRAVSKARRGREEEFEREGRRWGRKGGGESGALKTNKRFS